MFVVPLVALGLACYAGSQTVWRASELARFLLLLGCGMVSVAATPRTAYIPGGMTRDFLTVWVLPVAILLPPVYAMLTPIPLQVLTQLRVHRGVVYRRVFTVAAIAYRVRCGVSGVPRVPAFLRRAVDRYRYARPDLDHGRGRLRDHRREGAQLLDDPGGIKLTDPTVRFADLELNREALQGDFAEFDLGVLITVVVGVNVALAVFAVPTVLLVRRFMMHAQLLAQSRVDTKTGLLNASTWEREAEIEIARAIRTKSPLALALVDIDHFKLVNDTYGHLAGDKALRAVTDALRNQLRAYDLAGRFGGEEFAILLPQAREIDALNVAERLRAHVAAMSIPVDDKDESGQVIRLTISVGVAALNGESRELTDMLAAADAALYHAKETGRNRTHVISASAPTA